MTTPDFTAELDAAIIAVRKASAVCRRVQAGITPESLEKRDRSPVTVADFASQAVVCKTIDAAFPDDAIVAEEEAAALSRPENAAFTQRIAAEAGLADAEIDETSVGRWIDRGAGEADGRYWTLDPIDGTKGFLRGGQYAVSLALLIDGAIQVAAVACPNLPVSGDGDSETAGVILYAVRGGGAKLVAIDEPGEQAAHRSIEVTSTIETSAARFCESVESGHSAHDVSAQIAEKLGIVAEPLRMDSQAKYAAVARGDADIYMRLPTRADYREKIWDHAGGALVVEEAGGRVTDITGKPLDWTHGRELAANRGVIVSNGRLHDAVIAAITETGAF